MKNTIRGVALNESIRILAINSTNIVRELCLNHQTTPCASAALGRSISIVSLMGQMHKNDDQLSIIIAGGGEIGKIHLQYLGNQKVRGYVDNPNVGVYLNEQNKLDVKRVVGTTGEIYVSVDKDLKSTYQSTSPIVSGEISEDFTYYFATSEQTPSVVSAGVLVNKDNLVISSGAIIIQLLPNASEEEIIAVEKIIPEISNLSTKLLDNDNINDFVLSLFPDFNMLDDSSTTVDCFCNEDDIYSKIQTLSLDDLNDILENEKHIEAICPWCNKKYHFNEQQVKDMIKNRL